MPISEGLVVNGLTALTSQISNRFIRKYTLPYRMRRRLSGARPDDVNSEILDALQRAIGNFKSLTTATNNSLIDIANSNLMVRYVMSFLESVLHG